MMKLPELDDKERGYIVVSMTERESDPSSATSASLFSFVAAAF